METLRTDCDVSFLQRQLREEMHSLKQQIEDGIEILEHDEGCLLQPLESIKQTCLHLESLASTFYLNCYLSPYTGKYVDLSISIRNLSERRHGALIVMQREEPVEWMLQPGTPLRAELSHPLLESIFYPGNPLHDGAVLIHHDHILSAGNVLPLSENHPHRQKYGTRHRAAIGLSERSDAVVLVISEETGRASFAYKGNLYTFISP